MPHNMMEGRDLYLRYQTGKEKLPDIRCIRVWNAELFYRTTLKDCLEQEPPVLVTLATQTDYAEARGWKQ